MKYINTFKLYESLSSLKMESDDIFLPLRTEYDFTIGTGDTMGGRFNIWITKGINNDKFKYSDIESYLVHFLNYAETEGYIIDSIGVKRNDLEFYSRLGDLYQLNSYESLHDINIHLKTGRNLHSDIQKNEHNFIHLNHINHFESHNKHLDIMYNIKDYLLPVSDKGFSVDIQIFNKFYEVEIFKKTNSSVITSESNFDLSEINEDVYGLIDFMEHNFDMDIKEIHLGIIGGDVIINLSKLKDYLYHDVYAIVLYF